jgi:hypothetical protein
MEERALSLQDNGKIWKSLRTSTSPLVHCSVTWGKITSGNLSNLQRGCSESQNLTVLIYKLRIIILVLKGLGG